MKNLDQITTRYCELQREHGDPSLDAIISGGKTDQPNICFMFMNPTARNIAASKNWHGIKAPWIGTKAVWTLFSRLGLFDADLTAEINKMSPGDWTPDFAEKVYNEVTSNSIYITNLAKCTQPDARHLRNSIFREYLELTRNEISIVKPRLIVTFGNQVSSVFLEQRISVSQVRRKVFTSTFNGEDYNVLAAYYPVGQGRRNMPKSISDIMAVQESFALNQVM
ncbi:hypothetical protein GF357_03630 [Candidatus Dojkabacteria bacterium]|nr:hypothetical protein [Candidatus Dojkabacteria bacterium]